MPDLLTLPTWTKAGNVHVVVETPRGARTKIKLDPELQAMILWKPLILGLRFPYDFGFLPSTHAEDGDPLDALVIHEAATFPGIVIRCRPVGVVKVSQREKGEQKSVRNDRIIAIPEDDHRGKAIEDARQLSEEIKTELEKFFTASVALKDRDLEFLGWGGPEEAKRLIQDAERLCRDRQLHEG